MRLSEGGRTRDVALDGTLTGRLARGVARVWWLPEARRAVLHLDPDHDAAGLLVVDAAADAVVDAVIARDLTPSPSGRYWAMEEHAIRRTAIWPHNETVYAVYDAAVSTAQLARACPSADDRCRGEVLFLPDRLALCRTGRSRTRRLLPDPRARARAHAPLAVRVAVADRGGLGRRGSRATGRHARGRDPEARRPDVGARRSARRATGSSRTWSSRPCARTGASTASRATMIRRGSGSTSAITCPRPRCSGWGFDCIERHRRDGSRMARPAHEAAARIHRDLRLVRAGAVGPGAVAGAPGRP